MGLCTASHGETRRDVGYTNHRSCTLPSTAREEASDGRGEAREHGTRGRVAAKKIMYQHAAWRQEDANKTGVRRRPSLPPFSLSFSLSPPLFLFSLFSCLSLPFSLSPTSIDNTRETNKKHQVGTKATTPRRKNGHQHTSFSKKKQARTEGKKPSAPPPTKKNKTDTRRISQPRLHCRLHIHLRNFNVP